MYVRIRHRPSTIIDNETVTIQYNPHPMRRGERSSLATIVEFGRTVMGGEPACTCTTAAAWRRGKVFVLSGELDGDRITPCCKASYSSEKNFCSASHRLRGRGEEELIYALGHTCSLRPQGQAVDSSSLTLISRSHFKGGKIA